MRSFRFLSFCLMLGAFCFAENAWSADCNANSVDDAIDIASGASKDCNSNSIPDECDVTPQRITAASPVEITVDSASVDSQPFYAITADFNGDGKPDILSNRGNLLSVILKSSSGTGFETPILYRHTSGFQFSGSDNVQAIAAADVDHDGDIDYVFGTEFFQSRPSAAGVTFHAGRNDGGGVFTPVDLTVSGLPSTPGLSYLHLLVKDLNGDNIPDLIFTTNYAVYVALASSPFQYAVTFVGHDASPNSQFIKDVTALDINGDGDLDLVAIGSENINFYFNDGSGGFSDAGSYDAGSHSARIFSADLNADSKPDLVVLYSSYIGGDRFFAVALNEGSGAFSAFHYYDIGTTVSSFEPQALFADVDGDSKIDILVSTDTGGRILFNDGSGIFQSRSDIYRTTGSAGLKAVADFDLDTKPDFLFAEVEPLIKHGLVYYNSTTPPVAAVSTDTNGDSIPDECDRAIPADFIGVRRSQLVDIYPLNGFLSWVMQDYVTRQTIGITYGLTSDTVHAADYFGTGRFVPGVVRNVGGFLYWYRYQTPEVDPIQFGLAGDKILTGYIDNDRIADLVVVRPINGFLYWFLRRSSDELIELHVWGIAGNTPFLADLDGDGTDELIVSGLADSGGIVWYGVNLNTGRVSFENWGLAGDTPLPPIDVDGDNKADLIVSRDTPFMNHVLVNYALRSSDRVADIKSVGVPGDLITFGNYNGVNAAEISVNRHVPTSTPGVVRLTEFYQSVGLAQTPTIDRGFVSDSEMYLRSDGRALLSNPLSCTSFNYIDDGAVGQSWDPQNSGNKRPRFIVAPAFRKQVLGIQLVADDATVIDDFKLKSSSSRSGAVYEARRLTATQILHTGYTPLAVRVFLKSGAVFCQRLKDPRLPQIF